MRINWSILFKKAHTMTKMVIKSGDDYKTTFGLCLKLVLSNYKHDNTLFGNYCVLPESNGVWGAWIDGKVTKLKKLCSRPEVGDEVVIVKKSGEKVKRTIQSIYKNKLNGTLVTLNPSTVY